MSRHIVKSTGHVELLRKRRVQAILLAADLVTFGLIYILATEKAICATAT